LWLQERVADLVAAREVPSGTPFSTSVDNCHELTLAGVRRFQPDDRAFHIARHLILDLLKGEFAARAVRVNVILEISICLDFQQVDFQAIGDDPPYVTKLCDPETSIAFVLLEHPLDARARVLFEPRFRFAQLGLPTLIAQEILYATIGEQ
jgi:hypothetical protein